MDNNNKNNNDSSSSSSNNNNPSSSKALNWVDCKMRCTFFSLSTLVCSLGKKYLWPFSPFCQSFVVEAPYILHALPSLSWISFLNGTKNCAISSQTVWVIFGSQP